MLLRHCCWCLRGFSASDSNVQWRFYGEGKWAAMAPKIWACRRLPQLFIHKAYNVLWHRGSCMLHQSCKLTSVKLLLTCISSLCLPHSRWPQNSRHFLSARNAIANMWPLMSLSGILPLNHCDRRLIQLFQHFIYGPQLCVLPHHTLNNFQ